MQLGVRQCRSLRTHTVRTCARPRGSARHRCRKSCSGPMRYLRRKSFGTLCSGMPFSIRCCLLLLFLLLYAGHAWCTVAAFWSSATVFLGLCAFRFPLATRIFGHCSGVALGKGDHVENAEVFARTRGRSPDNYETLRQFHARRGERKRPCYNRLTRCSCVFPHNGDATASGGAPLAQPLCAHGNQGRSSCPSRPPDFPKKRRR